MSKDGPVDSHQCAWLMLHQRPKLDPQLISNKFEDTLLHYIFSAFVNYMDSSDLPNASPTPGYNLFLHSLLCHVCNLRPHCSCIIVHCLCKHHAGMWAKLWLLLLLLLVLVLVLLVLLVLLLVLLVLLLLLYIVLEVHTNTIKQILKKKKILSCICELQATGWEIIWHVCCSWHWTLCIR